MSCLVRPVDMGPRVNRRTADLCGSECRAAKRSCLNAEKLPKRKFGLDAALLYQRFLVRAEHEGQLCTVYILLYGAFGGVGLDSRACISLNIGCKLFLCMRMFNAIYIPWFLPSFVSSLTSSCADSVVSERIRTVGTTEIGLFYRAHPFAPFLSKEKSLTR